METQSRGRGPRIRRVHAFSALVVERPVRQRATRPGLRLAGQLVLQAGVCCLSGRRLLANECPGLHPDAQRRPEDLVRKARPLFVARPGQGHGHLSALHCADRGVSEVWRPQADPELLPGARRRVRSVSHHLGPPHEPGEHPTSNNQHPTTSACASGSPWAFDVGCFSPYSRQAACTAFIACSPLARSTTTEILISLVEIISILIPSRASVSNILPATPVWLFMPTPTMDSLAILSVAMTAPKPTSGFSASMTFCALSRSGLSTVNERSVAGLPLPWLMFCTIISTFTVASPIALKMRAATPGLSGTATSVTFAWFLSSETPRTTTSSIFLVSSFTMVPGFSLRLERTSKMTANFLANSTERDCMTFAPRLASSSISS